MQIWVTESCMFESLMFSEVGPFTGAERLSIVSKHFVRVPSRQNSSERGQITVAAVIKSSYNRGMGTLCGSH